MKNEEKARRVLEALDSGKVPITWHCIDEDALVKIIACELNEIEREENDG